MTLNDLADQQHADQHTLRRIQELNERGLEGLTRIDVPGPAEPEQPPTTEPEAEVPTINLEARRDVLSEAHRECFKELHRLEGEIRGIDHILNLINPQTPVKPADTAEGDKK